MRILVSVILFTILFAASAACNEARAQAQNGKSVEDRVKLLEDYNERVLQQQFDAQGKELSTTVILELDKAKTEVKDQLRVFQIGFGVFNLVVGIGIGAFLYFYLRKVPKLAEQALNKKLEAHLEEKTTQILELLTARSTENKIRTSKKIFVVAGSEDELSKTLKLFKDMKFAKVEGAVFRYYRAAPQNDLLVFSAQDRSLPEDLIKEFLAKGSVEDSYVYYGAGRLSIDQAAPYAEQINFANSRYTLYNQVFTVLAFDHVTRNT